MQDFIRALLTLKFTCSGDKLIDTLQAFLANEKHQVLLQTITEDDVKAFVEEQKKVSPNPYRVTLYLPEYEDEEFFKMNFLRDALLAAAYYPKELDLGEQVKKERDRWWSYLYLNPCLAYAARYGMHAAIEKLIAIIEKNDWRQNHPNFYNFLLGEQGEEVRDYHPITLYFEGQQDILITNLDAYHKKMNKSNKRSSGMAWSELDELWAIIKAKNDNFITRKEAKGRKELVSSLKEPLSPFFTYKTDVSEEFKKLHPEKKPSELTALIAERWNNLDQESRRNYERIYEESLEKYKQSWGVPYRGHEKKIVNKGKSSDENQIETKKQKIDKKPMFVTNILKNIETDMKVPIDHIPYVSTLTLNDYNSEWEVHDSWANALSYVKAQYRDHLKKYRSFHEDIDNPEKYGDGANDVITSYVRRIFDAKIIDFSTSEMHTLSESKLRLELEEELKRRPKTVKFVILKVLSERNFSPQAIRDTILFLPQIKLTDKEIHAWDLMLQSSYSYPELEEW